MKVPLEEFVPYDQSVRYRVHDAYYSASGGESWSGGRIPFVATSNFAIARQHATMVIAVVAELLKAGRLGPREKIWLLEVGAGNGAFAANFLRALETGTGTEGRRVLKRLRYVMSDLSRNSVQDGIAGHPLRDYVDAGRLVPAVADLGAPETIVDLDGNRLDRPFALVFANYLCCATRLKIVKKSGSEYFESYARVEVEVADDVRLEDAAPAGLLESLLAAPKAADLMQRHTVSTEWRPVKLPELLPDGRHGEAIRQTLAPFHEATLTYPYVFFDWLAKLRPRLLKGAAIFVSDYGYSDEDGLGDRDVRTPQHYGNTVNHPVEFGLFDAVGPLLGYACARTRDPLASVHTAILRHQARLPRRFEALVDETYTARTDGEDLVDFRAAARLHFEAKEYRQAARMYQRCLRLDPDNLEFLFRLGEACVEGQLNRLAASWLERGVALDTGREQDFHFQLGRAYYRLGRHAKAIAADLASLEREKHPVTYANLAAAYEASGDLELAKEAYRAALALDPEHARARERLAALEPGQP
jgi:tetratricopeptide (TPR) repeat protein